MSINNTNTNDNIAIVKAMAIRLSDNLAKDTHQYAVDNDIPMHKMLAKGIETLDTKLLPSVIQNFKLGMDLGDLYEKVYTELYTEITSNWQ